MSGSSNNLKKLLKYRKDTTIFVFLNDLSLPSASVAFPKRLALYLKDVELSKATLLDFQHHSLKTHLF